MTQTSEGTQNELAKRHRAAWLTVVFMGALTLLLAAFALTGAFASRLTPDPFAVWSLRALMLFFAIGALFLRRTRFNAARLQDIASLGGLSALLTTLQNTTRLIALIGGAVAVMGFVVFTMTGDLLDVVRFVIVASAVLFYAYPRLAAWRRVVSVTAQEEAADPAGTPPAKGTIA
ncbi:MAG TPA: hypothetical protein VER08_03000 [Pyrinomonadaceae bacterium]|nr:hypothetical protein [Pyrinomonadaceae bacterium]